MSSHMPPVPPQSRSKRGGKTAPHADPKGVAKDHKHHNNAEQGDQANIHQNTTHKDYTGGSRGR